MESLRWILLAAGAVFVLVIYILGRNRRRRNNDSSIEDLDDSLPEFSARSLDDVDEGVGEVRIVTGEKFDTEAGAGDPQFATDSVQYDALRDDPVGSADEYGTADEPVATDETTTENDREEAAAENPSDISVLYILPKPGAELNGAQINSSAQAMGLRFGDMNIFHYRPHNRNVFSMANMLEPGSFDPETIHDLKTSGLTVFMRITGRDPLDDLTEMLQRSYQLAGLLDARLCNSKRQPLTEQDAENYRTQARSFIG